MIILIRRGQPAAGRRSNLRGVTRLAQGSRAMAPGGLAPGHLPSTAALCQLNPLLWLFDFILKLDNLNMP